MVRKEGVEPSRVSPYGPEPYAYAIPPLPHGKAQLSPTSIPQNDRTVNLAPYLDLVLKL